MRTKNFVVLTDTESVINLEGTDPEKFLDILTLTAQANSLDIFDGKLHELMDDHAKAVDKLMKGGKRDLRAKVPKGKLKKDKRIR